MDPSAASLSASTAGSSSGAAAAAAAAAASALASAGTNAASDNLQFEQRRAQILGHHSEIVDKIDQIQKKTTQILQEQETALLRSFQTELAELNAELAAEKKKVCFLSVLFRVLSNRAFICK
jgi:hypothetical protein